MTRRLLAVLAFTIPFVAAAATDPATQRVYETATGAPQMPSRTVAATPPAIIAWRAPLLEPVDLVSMPAVVQQKSSSAIGNKIGQPLQVGTNQPLAKAASIVSWNAVPGGFVAKIRASSQGAVGLRVRLDLGTVPGEFALVAQGSGSPRLEAMTIDPSLGNTHWTPWTDGSSQVIELFSPVQPSAGAVSVGAVANFSESPLETKSGSGACTVPASCGTGDTGLDGAIAERVKSNVKLLFAKADGQFLCTATLINNPLAAPFLVTANHCINTVDEAASTATYFFYETQSCTDLTTAPGLTQVPGGAQLVFTNFNIDSTLLRMNQAAPGGAVLSGWSAAHVADGTAIVSVSHPGGDSSRIALGTVSTEFRVADWPYDMYAIKFTTGIIEGGSSGSGLYTLDNGSLNLRGVLTGTTTDNGSDGLSCTDLNEYALYDRFEVFEPEIDQYISGNIRTDDAPNRVQDFTGVPITEVALDQRSSPRVYPNMQINYAGDVDVYRFTLSAAATVHAYATGGLDTVGTLMDSSGTEIDANDDESGASNDFGITHALQPGTYFVAVGHWDPTGTGTYTLNLTTQTAAPATVNYTDLWWNFPAVSESGWGINLNHQGDIIFATLFTYDASGAPLWLVLANGAKQSDGSFTGDLFHTTGLPFNASPWIPTPNSATKVGTMTLAFDSANTGTLRYTYNGTTVNKRITRESFSASTTVCTPTTGDRSTATNYQDLWWNPNESGWGMNVTQQGTTAFATLFDYDANGKATWFVMSDGEESSPGIFSGQLYTTKGPVFNASPWTPITAAQVGTMTLHFTSGNTGILNYTVNGVFVQKNIQREVFSSPTPQCQ